MTREGLNLQTKNQRPLAPTTEAVTLPDRCSQMLWLTTLCTTRYRQRCLAKVSISATAIQCKETSKWNRSNPTEAIRPSKLLSDCHRSIPITNMLARASRASLMRTPSTLVARDATTMILTTTRSQGRRI